MANLICASLKSRGQATASREIVACDTLKRARYIGLRCAIGKAPESFLSLVWR
jgi:hypothetical protein